MEDSIILDPVGTLHLSGYMTGIFLLLLKLDIDYIAFLSDP